MSTTKYSYLYSYYIYMAKSMKLGWGGRFAKLESSIEKSGKSPEAAGAIAASIGRKKYGNAKMASLSRKAKIR